MKKSPPLKNKTADVIIYQTKQGALKLKGDVHRQTLWATQAEMATLFGVNPQAVTKHIGNIYKDGELEEEATCSKMEQVQLEGEREVNRMTRFYNLDVIIAVGYRVNSVLGTQFRQWATKTLRP